MSVKIITYDLNKEKSGADGDGLRKTLKNLKCVKLSNSSYAVDTILTTKELYDKLKPYLDGNDNIFIGSLSRDATWLEPADVTKWLQARL